MLSQEHLKAILRYEEDTGRFYWIKTRRGCRHGGRAGCRSGACPYERIVIDGTIYVTHRLAWLYVHGAWPKDEIDHIDGYKLNNAIANLRECTGAENHQNLRKQRNNKTGFLGVSKSQSKDRFVAQITANGVSRYLGTFGSAEEASDAYKKAKAELHPFCPKIMEYV